MAEATVLKVNRKEVVALCQKLNLKAVQSDWPSARIIKKVEKFPVLFADGLPADLSETETEMLVGLIAAVKDGNEVAIDEPKKGGGKEKAGSNGKAPKAKNEPKEPKEKKAKNEPKEPKEKKVSALAAAHLVLKKAKEPMSTKELIDMMAKKGLWESPGGKTPDATLCAAIIREISVKGKESRFEKAAPGRYVAK
jgi:hypothetical protein